MELTNIKKREIQTLKMNVATHMLAYDTMNEKEAIEAWHKVPELAQAFEDMAYGSILKHMKEVLPKAEWPIFLDKIGMMSDRGGRYRPKANVFYLMEFAGYKEEGGAIETASHYREVKKVVGKDQGKIDEAYKELDSPKTAKDVKEQVQSRESLWLDAKREEDALLEEFLTLRPDLKVSPYIDSNAQIKIPSRISWKLFFATVSHCIHPDKGGDAEMQDILNNINSYMKNEISKESNKYMQDVLNREFSVFKRNR